MKIIYIFLTILCVLVSCKQKSTNFDIDSLHENILSNSNSLHVDTIIGADFFPTVDYFLYHNDSIIIVLNKGQGNNPFLNFYNIKRNEVVKSTLFHGKGPKEMLFPVVDKGGDELLLRDIQSEKYCVFNVDSFLNNDNYSFKMTNNEFIRISSLCKFNDDIVAENSYTFIDEKKEIIQDCGPKIVKVNQLEKLYKESHTYNTINVASNGEILVNSALNRMVYAYSGQSLIEIYDGNLNIIKKISGPVNLDVDYYISEDNEVIYKRKIPYTYLSSCKNDKYFYLYFIGDYWYIDTKSMDNHKGYILKFDWNGNYVKSYVVDNYLYSLSCDKTFLGKDILYVTVNDINGVPIMVKLYE